MNRLRVMFSKGESIKYISHLDTLRTFERAVRRAGIPIAYSQGFNPRPQMSFGLPLSVGVTSDSEYVDIDMDTDIPAEEFIEKLNASMPEGFKIIKAGYIEAKESLMSSVGGASYKVTAEVRDNISLRKLKENMILFMSKESINIEKESKGKQKIIDIKPDIFNFDLVEIENDRAVFEMTLSAGSVSNLKPELAMKAFGEFLEVDIQVVSVHRTALYGQGLKMLLNS